MHKLKRYKSRKVPHFCNIYVKDYISKIGVQRGGEEEDGVFFTFFSEIISSLSKNG